MRAYLYLLAITAATTSSTSCKSVECGAGTIEREGACAPAEETIGSAHCGKFTELEGDVCVPMFPPTTCDPGSTTADTDPTTGVTTCVGTGQAAGCNGVFACPAPAAGKQTACGQLYDIVTGDPFQKADAKGTPCVVGSESDGPCSLGMQAFDAVSFAGNPQGTAPLDAGTLEIDDCGRFRLKDISQPAGPLIALGIDDVATIARGPGGTTQPVGISFPKAPNTSVANLEHFIVNQHTTQAWSASGGPAVTNGIFVPIFRAHLTGLANAAGVTVTKNGAPIPNDDFYFGPTDPQRLNLEGSASQTGLNGAALVSNALLNAAYSGSGGLAPSCAWAPHPGASVANVVFVQVFRPQDDGSGGTCAQ